MLIFPEGPCHSGGESQVSPMSQSHAENRAGSHLPQTVPFTAHAGDAARALISAIQRHGEGTWEFHIESAAAPVLSIEVRDEMLVDLERPGRRSLLHRALLDDSLLKSRDLQRLERRGLEEQRCPGILCLEEGTIEPVKAAERIAAILSSDLMEVLTAVQGEWRGPFQRPIDSGMCGRVEVGLSPQQALLRSARQHGLWDAIGELPLLREVISATPSAFALVQHPQTSAEVKSLLESADGQQDLFELTRHRADSWRAFDRALELLEEGHLEALSAIPLFQLGEQKLTAGDSEAALRHWRRAEEKGLDDFDLCGRIGEICAGSERRMEALIRLRQHARRSTEQLRFEAARQAWTQLAFLEPADEEAVDRAIQLWVKEPGEDLADCRQLAELLQKSGRWNDLAELVSGVGAHQPDARWHQWHEEAARALGDEEMELKALWRRAECLRTGEDPRSALTHYRRLLDRGYQATKVSLRLAEVSLQQGDSSEARTLLLEVLQGRLRGALYECEESRSILESCGRSPEAPLEVVDFFHEFESARSQSKPAREALLKMIRRSESAEDLTRTDFRVKNWLTHRTDDLDLMEEWLTVLKGKIGSSAGLALIEFALGQMAISEEQRLRLIHKIGRAHV